MFGHLPELGLILIVALIVFGPEKLPEVAHNVGKLVRDVRQALDTAMNPEDHEVPDDFSTYYYESLARSGEAPPTEALSPEDAAGEHLGTPEEDLPTSDPSSHRADWS